MFTAFEKQSMNVGPFGRLGPIYPCDAIACFKVCSAFHAVLQTRISQNNLVGGKIIFSIKTLCNVHACGHYIRAMRRYICYLPV